MKREEKNVKHQAEKKIKRDTLHASRFTHDASRFTFHASRHSPGFTLLEVVGVLAVIGILAAMILPNFLSRIEDTTRTAESGSLKAIAEAVELYLRETHAFPATLSALSPDYVSFGDAQLSQNRRSFPRYYVLHPTMATFDNT